jgi:hypothetical protein
VIEKLGNEAITLGMVMVGVSACIKYASYKQWLADPWWLHKASWAMVIGAMLVCTGMVLAGVTPLWGP